MKKIISFFLAVVCLLGLVGCSNNKSNVWDWAQSLTQEDIVSVIPWHCDTEHTESEPLNEEEIRELAALLNGLTKKSFTENKHLVGITATVGINLETDSQIYHINYAPSPYGKYGMLEMKYGEKQWWIDDAELSAFVLRITKANPTEKISEVTEPTATVTEPESSNFFAFDESLEAYLVQHQFAEETGDLLTAKTPIAMTEEEKQILLDLLKPYADTISGDVLKCDYLRYYSIEIDDRMTLTIDPKLGNYGDKGDSYMFMMEHYPGAYIKGTYIDAELVNFLADRLAEEG